MTRWIRIGSLALLMGVAACSSSDKPAANTAQQPSPGQKTTVSITAAKGGTVSIGSASLDIPAGSLGADVDVTLETVTPPSTLPDSASLSGLLYDFGPDGTTFSKPATLSLPLASTPPSGKEAVVSFLDETTNKWVDLQTTSSGGKVSAPVAHFTKFIVRLRDAAAGPVDCSFSACGGSLVGTWKIDSACVDKGGDAGTSSNPFGSACPDAVFDVSLDASGTVTFGADQSFDFTLTGTPSIAVTVPASCLTSGMLPIADCVSLASTLDKNGGVTCTGDKTSGCNCTGTTGSGGPSNQHKTGTYSVSGTSFTTTTVGDGGGVGDPTQFCVSGTSLKVLSKDGTVINGVKQ